MKNRWYHLSTKEVFEKLSTGVEGLSVQDAEKRQGELGLNELSVKEEETLCAIFLRQFKSPLIYILCFAALISFIMRKYEHGFVIFAVLIINAVTGFIQESRAKKSMDALKELSAPKARVLRDGKAVDVEAKYLVPGDIIVIEAGAKIPADARVIETVRLQVNEAALTGESNAVYKIVEEIKTEVGVPEMLNMLFAGTVVVSGRGVAVVVETGAGTQIGQMAEIIQSEPEPKTQFQVKMDKLGKFIIVLVSIQVTAVFLVGFLLRDMAFYDIFLVVLSQLVSSIPEGLPVALMVALSVGMQRMARRKALVRKLYAVEGIGGVSIICSDKTGTLTRNEMTATRIATVDGKVEISGVGYNKKGSFTREGEEIELSGHKNVEMLLRVGVLCNNAGAGYVEGRDILDVDGDPTEVAYLVAAIKAGINLEEMAKTYPRIDELPFDPEAQMMATENNTPEGKHLVSVKGSPEQVVQLCGYYMLSSGEVKKIDDTVRTKIIRQAEELAADALRVLAFGYAEKQMADIKHLEFDEIKGDLIFAGLVGNIDPPRDEAKQAIRECKSAGIRTIMVTGDHLATAEAIGAELGIHKQGDKGIAGMELNRMTDEEVGKRIQQTSVFARIEPQHKFRIVKILQKSGYTVAMTGDGLNDAPALSASDIGVAMGITGTDIAKDASNIVIEDDNFATIVYAVEEGRGITANMRKTLLYLLTSSNTEVLVLLLALFAGLPLPLLPLMILWINLVTDGTQTVNLIMEPKEDVMAQKPSPRDEPLLTPKIFNALLVRIPVMAAGILGLFVFFIRTGGDVAYARTIAFTTLACSQWMNGLSSRSMNRSIFRMPFFSNKYLLAGLGAAIILQVIVVYLPFMQRLFETVSIAGTDWFKIVGISSAVLWAEEIRKLAQRRRSL